MSPFKTLLAILTLSFTGCIPPDSDYNFEYETIITEYPANLQKLNSEYDDYNLNLPYPAARSEIYYSTNRNSSGGNFDIIYKSFDISYHKKNNVVNFSFPENTYYTSFQQKLFALINKESNEFGPYTFNGPQGWEYFFYANNVGEDYDIKFVYTPRLDWGTYNGQERLFGPVALSAINSDHDDLYPTINQEGTKIYFCSNREDNLFKIYSGNINPESLLHETLVGSTPLQLTKEEALSGPTNDKCPSITINLLVFTSDRPGGFGGYDLYYSLYKNDKWSAPVNFGDKINSEYDEYRPITFTFAGTDLMIFSSDRPGGKGGYDLYGVKIGDLIY
jgi:hypothetical protein